MKQEVDITLKFSPTAKIVTFWIITSIIVLFLSYITNVLAPFIWAVVAAYFFHPVVTWLEKKSKIPKVVWIIVLYFLLISGLYFGFKLVSPLIHNEFLDLVGEAHTGQSIVERLESYGVIDVFGFSVDMKQTVDSAQQWIRSQIPQFVVPVFFETIHKLIFVVVFLVVTLYLLLDAEKYYHKAMNLIPKKFRSELEYIVDRVNDTIGAYIRGLIVLIIIMSAASWIALTILHVRYALILSIATGILEVIPYVGPICAATMAATIAFLQPSVPYGLTNVSLSLIVISVYFVLRQIEDYFIIPGVVGKFVNVHPVVALFALLAGGTLGGILGIFLALPAAAVAKELFNYFYIKLVE